MAGLLGGVLPAIYSGADQLKRQVYGLLTNPMEMAERAGQNLLQSHNERQALMRQAHGDPTNPLKITDKDAFNALTSQVMAGELGFAPAGITTYHGSKYLFDKFDKSKIGSSSGIDYGYGVYSAESPSIAKGFMGKQGYFYKTDIPDEYIPKMINWYETKQTPEVTEILKKAGLPFNATGEEITMAAAQKMGGSDATKSGFQKAAEYLDSLGIKGNKVENFQIKNGQGADTFNYVVYNPDNIKLLERNNEPITGLLDTSYRGSHTAPNAKEYGATIDNLGTLMPKDVYSSEGIRLYGIRNKAIDSEWYRAVKKAEGNPDAEIEIFRAVPKGVKEINAGDWITTSKTYARDHGESALDGEYDILSKKVKAKTLSSEGYPYEFGYNPE